MTPAMSSGVPSAWVPCQRHSLEIVSPSDVAPMSSAWKSATPAKIADQFLKANGLK
jgi:hypothetical protein